MCNKLEQKLNIDNDNSGFSLIELLVSIIILALIMHPLLNNFFQAAKINQRAEKLKEYSNVASNTLERLKSLDLDQMLSEDDLKRVYYNHVTGNYTLDATDEEDGIYYFSIENITEGTSFYDAILKVSSDTYKYEGTDENHNGILMNNYEMPDIITVNSNVNAMLFVNMYRDSVNHKLSANQPSVTDKSLDKTVFDSFQSAAKAYADAQFRAYSAYYSDYLHELKAYQNGETLDAPVEPSRASIPPEDVPYSDYGNPDLYPDYCQDIDIQSNIERTLDITLSKEAVIDDQYNIVVNYQITYKCNWPSGVSIGEKQSFLLESKKYADNLNNIYLYYDTFLQSIIAYKPDIIKINNNSGQAVNFYIVNQKSVVEKQNLSIKFFRFGSAINIYTNMQDSQVKEYTIDSVTGTEIPVDETTNSNTVQNNIIKTQKRDHIFTLEVKIYPHSTDPIESKYLTEALYQLSSNRKY